MDFSQMQSRTEDDRKIIKLMGTIRNQYFKLLKTLENKNYNYKFTSDEMRNLITTWEALFSHEYVITTIYNETGNIEIGLSCLVEYILFSENHVSLECFEWISAILFRTYCYIPPIHPLSKIVEDYIIQISSFHRKDDLNEYLCRIRNIFYDLHDGKSEIVLLDLSGDENTFFTKVVINVERGQRKALLRRILLHVLSNSELRFNKENCFEVFHQLFVPIMDMLTMKNEPILTKIECFKCLSTLLNDVDPLYSMSGHLCSYILKIAETLTTEYFEFCEEADIPQLQKVLDYAAEVQSKVSKWLCKVPQKYPPTLHELSLFSRIGKKAINYVKLCVSSCPKLITDIISDICIFLSNAPTLPTCLEEPFIIELKECVEDIIEYIISMEKNLETKVLCSLFKFYFASTLDIEVDSFLNKLSNQSKSIVKNIRNQNKILSFLVTCDASDFIKSQFVPDNHKLMDIIKTIIHEYPSYEAFTELFQYIAAFLPLYNCDKGIVLSFLLLPWMDLRGLFDDGLLKKFAVPLNLDEKKIQFIRDITFKNLSIACIAKLKYANEIRKSIFAYSIKDACHSLKATSLEYAALFVSQCNVNVFNCISFVIMEEIMNSHTVETSNMLKLLLTTLSEVICSLDKNNTFNNNKIQCLSCTNSEKSGYITSMDLTEKFLNSIVSLLEAENSDDEINIKLASLLISILKHTTIKKNHYLKMTEAFFKLIGNYRSVDCDKMHICFKEIISKDIPKDILSILRVSLTSLEPSSQYPYLYIISTTMNEGSFLLSCISRMISMATDYYFHEDITVVDMSKKIILVNAAKANITTESLLKRYSHEIIPLMTETILSRLVPNPSSHTINGDKEKGNLINSYFRQLADIFKILPKASQQERFMATVRETVKYVVATLLFVDEPRKEYSRYILNHLATYVLRENLSQLISRSINIAFEYLLRDSNRRVLAITFIRELTGKEITEIALEQRALLKLTFLQNLSINKLTCLNHLSVLFWTKDKDLFSLTEIIKENVMGVFTGFRMSILDDERYYYRQKDLQSLALMIDNMDANFVCFVSNKLLNLLRSLTILGEMAVPPWYHFMEKLSVAKKIELLPKILTSVALLLKFPTSTNIINIFLQLRLKEDLNSKQKERFDRVFSILYSCGLQDHADKLNSEYLHKFSEILDTQCTAKATISNCARVLYEEGSEIVDITLKRLDSLLDGTVLEDQLSQELIPAILYAIRSNNVKNIRKSACIVLGKIGAIDPGRLRSRHDENESLSYGKSIEFANYMPDTPKEFLIELLENFCQLLLNCISATDTDNISYAIQKVLKDVIKGTQIGKDVWSKLSPNCKIELEPFTNCGLYPFQKCVIDSRRPVISYLVVNTFFSWSKVFYLALSEKLTDRVVGKALAAAEFITKTDNPEFFFYLLKNVIVQAFIEKNNKIIEDCEKEISEIFKRCLHDSGWVRVAAHSIFTLLDELTQYAYIKKADNINGFPDEIIEFIHKNVYDIKYNNRRLVIDAAEACQCWFRALKLTEHFGIFDDSKECQNLYHSISKISMKLDDYDNTLGAYECIETKFEPTNEQAILALEASRNYTEALSLYRESESSPVSMIDCLLKIDQPNLAFSQIGSILKSYSITEDEKKMLEERKIVTLWKLSRWDQLENAINQTENVNLDSWEASSALIFNAIHKKNKSLFSEVINECYDKMEVALSAITLQNSENYEQTYRYMQKLHMLFEITDSKRFLFVDANESITNQSNEFLNVINKWKKRADKCIQGGGALEPILANRREILKMIPGEAALKAIGDEYLHSAHLARFENNLDNVWSFITHAKEYPVNPVQIGMEKAAYFAKKNNHSHAIKVIQRCLQKNCQALNSMYNPDENNDSSGDMMDFSYEINEEDKCLFIKARLDEIDYRIDAGVGSYDESHNMFQNLVRITPPPKLAEKIWYKAATFVDGFHVSDNKGDSDIATIKLIIQAYINVLINGSNFSHHVIPRLLTLWLDYTHKYYDSGEAGYVKILNDIMINAFTKKIDPSMCYKAIQQIFSRLAHPDSSVFDVLKMLVIRLIEKFPHQCLWHMMGIYRTSSKKNAANIRVERMKKIVDVACETIKFNRQDFKQTVKAYEYLSASLMSLGNKNTKSDRIKSVEIPKLKSFFLKKEMIVNVGKKAVRQRLTTLPKIILPLSSLLDDPTPAPSFNSFTLTQNINMDEISKNPSTINEIYITDVDENVMILPSLMKPKRLTLIGSDGKMYPILCKDSDELRKDLRAMEFNKRVNSLLIQCPEARRRHLRIRTYTVVPLQEEGGIIEWVPNLIPLKAALTKGTDQIQLHKMSAEIFSKWSQLKTTKCRKEFMKNELFKKFPKRMAEYFRRQYVDPGTWYNSRLNYTRTSATMCMVGFILGLGDRHCENILLDTKSGEIMHVDYNILFNKGESLRFPEVVPFRLTRNVIDGFGPCGVEGNFRISCELSLAAMRNNKEMLLTLLHSFIHDPLLEWSAVERRNQQLRIEETLGGLPMKTNNAPIDAKNAIYNIERRLSGFIVSPKIYKDLRNYYSMSVTGQVDKLINIARNENKLADMYIGWAPYL